MAARSVVVVSAWPGAITDIVMSAGGAPSVLSERTWTWSTLPTSSTSVPGRAWRASSLEGSGPWSAS